MNTINKDELLINNLNRDNLLDYVIGSLSEEEESSVELYLNEHASEASFVCDLFASLTAIVLAQEPAEVPETSLKELLDKIRR